MKHGAEYAKRVKRLISELSRKFGKLPLPEPTDPLEQLIIGILAGCTTYARAHAAFRKIRAQMVDFNELRVTPASELADAIDDTVPRAAEKARRIIDALNAIRRRQDSLDISFLKQRGRREAREYLESLEGVDRMAAACVVVYSLGGHAVPVDDLTRYVLQKEEIVDPAAGLAEIQAFLERQVNSSNARLFAEQLNRYVNMKGARVPVEKLPQLLAPPPASGNGAARPAAEPSPKAASAKPQPSRAAVAVKASKARASAPAGAKGSHKAGGHARPPATRKKK